MLAVVTFKWTQARYHSTFTADYVNRLRNMVARHYAKPHRFYCVTDDPAGLDARISFVPLWDDYARVPNPSNKMGPSCFRRLKIFSAEAKELFGERLVTLDLDTIIVRDITPLWDRPEPFLAWGDTRADTYYNGSMIMLTTGSRTQVWTEFNPHMSPLLAHRARCFGSDQGWISFKLGPDEARWTMNDGIYSWRVHLAPNGGALPDDARVVMFHGKQKPWNVDHQYPWIAEHWR